MVGSYKDSMSGGSYSAPYAVNFDQRLGAEYSKPRKTFAFSMFLQVFARNLCKNKTKVPNLG